MGGLTTPAAAITGIGEDADGWRLPAKEVDSVVEYQLALILRDSPQLSDWVQDCHPAANLAKALESSKSLARRLTDQVRDDHRALVRKLVRRVILKPGTLTIEIDRPAIVAELLPELVQPQRDDKLLSIECPISLRRRGVEMRIVVANSADQRRQPDGNLVQLILRAHRYLAMLNEGQGRGLSDIAAIEKVNLSEVSRILPLAFLSPSIVDSIIAGTQPVSLTAQRLSRLADLPALWRQVGTAGPSLSIRRASC